MGYSASVEDKLTGLTRDIFITAQPKASDILFAS
jgi:hypothetical protein